MRCGCVSSLYSYYTTLLVVLLLVLRATPHAIPITRVMLPSACHSSLHSRERRLRPAHAWRTAVPSVCPCSVLGCIAAWARWRHIGFIQYCSIAQAIALCPDRFAGACRDPCIRTRGHGTRDHLPGECVVRPRSPRAGVVVKSFCLDIEVRNIVASVRCAQQELVIW